MSGTMAEKIPEMFRPIAVRNRLTTPYGRKVLGNLKQCVLRKNGAKNKKMLAKQFAGAAIRTVNTMGGESTLCYTVLYGI